MSYTRNPHVRREALNRDKACVRCQCDTDLVVHHIIALADDGKDSLTNAITLCEICHREWHSVYERYLEWPVFVTTQPSTARQLAVAAMVDHGHSARTKAALEAAKARGVLLGNRTNIGDARALAAQSNREAGKARRDAVMPLIDALRARGVSSYAGIARALNEQGVPTARGGEWHASTVRNACAA